MRFFIVGFKDAHEVTMHAKYQVLSILPSQHTNKKALWNSVRDKTVLFNNRLYRLNTKINSWGKDFSSCLKVVPATLLLVCFLSLNESTCQTRKTKFIKKFYQNFGLQTSSRPFCVCKELSKTSIGKWNFWSKLLILDT